MSSGETGVPTGSTPRKLLSWHVPWKCGHAGSALGLEVLCTDQMLVFSLACVVR
jgi:hypothetical protein